MLLRRDRTVGLVKVGLTALVSQIRVLLQGPYLVAVLALVSGLASAGFIFAPVLEHTATYYWKAAPGDDAAGLPLNPYRPAKLQLTVPCSVLAGAATGGRGGPLVATTREGPAGSATDLAVEVSDGRLLVRSQGQPLVSTTRPWAGCTALQVNMTSSRSTVALDGRPLIDLAGDRRPVVRGFFTSGEVMGVEAVVVADTRYDTSPTPGKVVLGLLAVAGLAGAVLLLALRRPSKTSRTEAEVPGQRARRWTARARLLDGVVAAVLVYVAVVGPVTDDDGFIVRITGTRAMSGFVGNHARWNNTPEAPFGWFYELYAGWSQVSVEPVWLRIPPLLLGLASWWVLAHLLLPRLLTRPMLAVRVGVAAAFLSFWICFGNTLRPEPWVGLGLGVVMLLVDVAVVRRNLAVLTVAATTAALTLGVGPTGLVAFGPFLVAAPRLVRWFRAMAGAERLTFVLLLMAGVGVVAVPMFADQSWAAVRAGTAIRIGMGPSFPWWEDWRRYVKLSDTPFAKQWAVYLAAVATAFTGVVALRARRVGGVRRAMQTTALGSVALVFPLMALGPTKLAHHFGGLMLAGPLVVGLALHLLRSRPRLSPLLWGGAVTSLGVGLGGALAAPSNWWQLSALGIPNATRPQQVAGVALATPVLAVSVFLGVAVLLAGGWATGPGDRKRRLPVAGLIAVGLTVVLIVQLGSFGYAAAGRVGRYSLAAANLHALAGNPCLLENTVQVEPEPGRTALRAEGRAGDFSSAATLGLPTWSPHTDRGSWRSGWFTLPTNVRDGSAQLVIRVRGLSDQRSVRAEFDTGTPVRLRAGSTDGYVDHPISLTGRKDVPQRMRLSAVWSGGRGRLATAVPRAQQMVSLRELSRHAAVTSGWKLAFFTPCLTSTAETAGAVAVPEYWLSRERVLNEMEWAPRAGGPLAGLRDLVSVEPLPTRVKGDAQEPVMDSLRLYALSPRYTSLIDQPERTTVVQPG